MKYFHTFFFETECPSPDEKPKRPKIYLALVTMWITVKGHPSQSQMIELAHINFSLPMI